MSKTDSRKKAEDFNKKGNQLLLKREFSEAKKMYEKAISEDKTFVDAYFNIGVVCAIKNDKDNAFKYFFKTIEIDPYYIKAFNKIGFLYSEENDYENAAKFYERGLKLAKDKYGRSHPDTKSIYNAISKMNSKINEKEADYKSYRKAQINMLKSYFENKGFSTHDYINENNHYHCTLLSAEKLIIFVLFLFERGNIKALDNIDRTQKPIWSIRNKNIPSLVWEVKRLSLLGKKLLDKTLPDDHNISIEGVVLINDSKVINADKMIKEWDKWGVKVSRFNKEKTDGIKPIDNLIKNIKINKASKSFNELTKTLIEYMDRSEDVLSEIDEELMKNKTIDKPSTSIFNKKENENEIKINDIGKDLTELATKGYLPPCLGREEEIKAIYEILNRKSKNNPLLLGYSGVGKTAIIEEIANRIVREDVPDFLKDKKIISITPMEILAGTRFIGDVEKRVKDMIDAVEKDQNIILFMDELHTIIGAGAGIQNSNDIAQFLKPMLSKKHFMMIGATTYDEYRNFIEKDKAFERRFYPIRIDEMNKESTKEILNIIKTDIEEYYNVNITENNIELVINLSDKYIKKRYFPDKALDILEKAAAKNSLMSKIDITDDDIKKVIEEYVGIQYLDTKDSSFKRLMEMENYLSKRIFGQNDAIKRVSNQIRLTKRGLDLKPERPDGVFLFTGSTGVGKTELAKSICEFLYGNQKKLIKLDMSEYSENSSVSKLLGSAPGYRKHDASFITKQIEENPSCVLLLDEIEKAHSDVVKLFLQVFDEGKIRDSRGKDIYFSDVTIIMTSNVIIKQIKNIGFQDSSADIEVLAEQRLIDELSKTFPIEFLNRIDEVILFNNLSYDNIKKILDKKLISKTTERFKKEGLKLKFDERVIDMLIKKGFDPKLGARNIERTFEKLIISEISNYIYKSEIQPQKLKEVLISYDKGKIIIN